MNVGTILDRDKEIKTKVEYNPQGKVLEYISKLYQEFNFDIWQFQKSYRFFNDRSPSDYFKRAQDDSFLYVPPKTDPLDWRNNMRWNEMRDKFDALMSFLIDLNFKCEPTALDYVGNSSNSMGEAAGALIQVAEMMDLGEEKNKMADYSLYRDGTVAEDIRYVVRKRIEKIADKWNPSDSTEGYSYTMRQVDAFEGIESQVMKLHRVYLGDVAQPIITLQPHLWKEYVIPYEMAYTLFHEYEAWKFVKPYDQQYDEWTDTDTDIETEEDNRNDKVRVRIYENIQRDEYAIFCNKVLMTPVGLKMPETGSYSITWATAGLLSPHFCYGRSFLANMRPYAVMLDVLRNIFIDKTRQGLEPPLVSRFRGLINRYMFKPGNVVYSQDGKLDPLIPEVQMQSFVFEAMKMLEGNIDKASISPVFQGQNAKGGQMTKYEVEQQLINSIRTMAGLVQASVNRRRQRAEKILTLALKYYPKMGMGKISQDAEDVKKFVMVGGEGMSKTEVMFGQSPKKPDLNTPPANNEFLDLTSKLIKYENKAKQAGKRSKTFWLDADEAISYRYIINYRVNPQQRDSKSADLANIEKKYNIYRADPNINPMAATKMLLSANGDDEQEFLMKQQPPSPGQGTPGQKGGQMQPGGAGAPPMAPGGSRPPQSLPGAQNPQDVIADQTMQ